MGQHQSTMKNPVLRLHIVVALRMYSLLAKELWHCTDQSTEKHRQQRISQSRLLNSFRSPYLERFGACGQDVIKIRIFLVIVSSVGV
jgi:hypothetical protein